MLSDAQIMLEVQRGRIELFDQLVARHRQRMLRFATSKLQDEAAAEDAVQEAWLAVYAARHTYRPEFAVSTWVYTVLINLCRRQARRRRQHRSVDVALESVLGRELTPLALLMAAERRELLLALLEELPETEADALRLRFFSGLMFEEIAAAMESSVSGAKVRVRRGLERLAKRLTDAADADSKPAGSHRGPDIDLPEVI